MKGDLGGCRRNTTTTRTQRLLCLVIATFCLTAFADSFRDRLKEGYNLLNAGDTDGAVAEFRDLQVDQPESEVVSYSLASAKFKQGELDLKNDAPQDAIVRFNEAKAAFDELNVSGDPFIRFNAAFNAANCSAEIAKNSIGLGDHEETVKAFEDSIHAYEDLARIRPDHEGVRTNLNHMRYLLKTLLQNPPPQQENQSGEGDEEDQQKEGEEENQDQQQQSDDEQAADPGEQENEEEQTAENPQEFNSAADENQEEAEPLNKQNIEAILQSLEDQDREEQKNLRRAKEPPRVLNRKWW